MPFPAVPRSTTVTPRGFAVMCDATSVFKISVFTYFMANIDFVLLRRGLSGKRVWDRLNIALSFCHPCRFHLVIEGNACYVGNCILLFQNMPVNF